MRAAYYSETFLNIYQTTSWDTTEDSDFKLFELFPRKLFYVGTFLQKSVLYRKKDMYVATFCETQI
jgi:hypothetical protein